MDLVEPVRDLKKVDAMKNYLKGRNVMYFTLFSFGINVALRISDLRTIKWGDVLKENKKTFKDLKILEGKTKKPRIITLNKSSRKALTELLDTLEYIDLDEYIFKSRKGANEPITRQHALRVLKEAGVATGVKENIGTHSLRKTWGYHAWKKGVNPAVIMETLNHSNLVVTRRYLGITQDDINDVYKILNL